jgi:hypothetical protein
MNHNNFYFILGKENVSGCGDINNDINILFVHVSINYQHFTILNIILTISKIIKSPLIILEERMRLDFFYTISPQSSCSEDNGI